MPAVFLSGGRHQSAAELAVALGGKKAGRQWVARCPAHEDRNPSLLIFDGHTSVQVRCQSGCSQEAVIAVLKARGLWSGATENDYQPQQRRQDDNREAEKHAALALQIWGEGVDPRSTDGEAYLRQRGLAPPAGDPTHVIRYHPRCPRGRDRQPALIALMRDLKTNKPGAIQRVFLTPDARKDAAMMLGPAGGSAMKLTSHWNTFWDDLNFCPRLYVCEGLETGLALLQQELYWPLWALGSAGAIRRMGVLFGVGKLVICADNDKAGIEAAELCEMGWNASTHQRAQIWLRDADGADFADDLEVGHGKTAAA